MSRSEEIASVLGIGVALVAVAACQVERSTPLDSTAAPADETTISMTGSHQGLLYGRVTTGDGATREGRLRFGADEEALWGNYFNGFRPDNPWLEYVPQQQLAGEWAPLEIVGIRLPWQRPSPFGRPFMARFGDIARIEPRGGDLVVVLKSGTVFHLDRFAADDVADGLRVWDPSGGVADIGEWSIRSIQFLPAPTSGDSPRPLFGTVRTREGSFTGLMQWDREQGLVSDELHGRSADGEVSLRFDRIRSIARRPDGGAVVTMTDDREVLLTSGREVGRANRGAYVDDPRYGRVLVSWEAIERVDFSEGGTGPSYGDFQPGRSLAGRVVTRSGRQHAGRIVYDLDENESTETLDAPSEGVDYTIPFSFVAAIELPEVDAPEATQAHVVLRSGEDLQLDRVGDLGESNAGLLIFPSGGQPPSYVPWDDVERVELEWE